MLDIFALVVLFVLCTAVIWFVVVIGNIPGNIARLRGHPQTEAITILAWVGLLTFGLGWFIALVWSKTAPVNVSAQVDDELSKTVREIDGRLQKLEAQS